MLALISFAQTDGSRAEQRPAPKKVAASTNLSAETVAEKSVNTAVASKWLSSVEENQRLARELSWVFGGRQQQGWWLYAPLVAQTLAQNLYSIDEPDFAAAVAEWQTAQRIQGKSGVIDDTTWRQLVTYFQSRRIKHRQEPVGDELVTIPLSECFDESRPEELRKMEAETYAAYKRMLAAAIADPTSGLKTINGQLAPDEKYLTIVSAYRSRAYQMELRRREPNASRAGLAVNSPHVTGRALDLYVGGIPTSTADRNRAAQVATPIYRWLVKNAGKFGFQPYFYEPWHWEYNPLP